MTLESLLAPPSYCPSHDLRTLTGLWRQERECRLSQVGGFQVMVKGRCKDATQPCTAVTVPELPEVMNPLDPVSMQPAWEKTRP